MLEVCSKNKSGTPTSRLAQLFVAKAFDLMIVDHTYRLHEGVADSRANKVEAALFQVSTHGVGLRRARRNPLI